MSTAKQMHVKVIDGLSTIGARVNDHAISTAIVVKTEALLLRDLACCCNQLTE